VNVLSFVLALGALALPVAWVVSGASLIATPWVRRLSPVARSEASAWLALLPALVALVLVAGVSVPSLLFGLGLGEDHCRGHEHHAHVCLWHGAVLPAWLACLGAVGWAASAVRGVQVLARLAHAERLGASLAALGIERDGFHVVPASVAVCHAVGLLRPRVVVSQSVVDGLAGAELRAVVAHERAHLDRADPRWSALLAVAGCLAPLGGWWWAATWREASEEAADDVAASVTDGPTVAQALVSVARMHLPTVPGFAFGATGLERRVVRLLEGPAAPRGSRASLGALGMVVLAALVVLASHEELHHAIEELWELAVRN
jgi:Zn-dependent protease with chaperone function